ncbi:MAG: benzoate-CoA ligase family protein [Alphaproteobacteria bacterium]|nr:benzoate-CoA ligase family protein [Alphaproteobacteria bacterium]
MTTVIDPVPNDTPGAQEIQFSVPHHYNAASILFDNLTAGRGDKVAVVTEKDSLSYAQICEQSCRIGNGLLGLGLARGDRVLLVLNDSPDYVAAIFGALRAGLVPLLINTLSPADQIAFFLEDSAASVALTHGEHQGLFAESQPKHLISLDSEDGKAWIANQSSDLAQADTTRDDMAFWMYSSGSTGKPKGVVHLHHDMAYTVESYAKRVLDIQETDICFSVPKIFFAYGFGNSITFPFAVGATTALLPGRPTPERMFALIAKCRPTLFFALPTVYTALIKHPAAATANLSSVRLCISAAEVLSGDVFTAWKNRFGHEIMEGLGSTEVLHIYLSNTLDQKKLGSAGKRVPGYELKLTDRDGQPVEPGEEGILWIRGDSDAPCYWNRPDKTAETMRGDWIWTGDRFTLDGDGFYFFRGRADDLIKVSGQWVYPLEVELCLNEHPKVTECAVMGLTMADGRTTLVAAVAPSQGVAGDETLSSELKDYVKTTLLPYKYPRRFLFLDTLPKTGTDKLDRQACKRLLSDDSA